MTFADQIQDHQARCQPHILTLRMLAQCETGAALPRRVTTEVREATRAVITEAEDAEFAVVGAARGGREPGARTFLGVRLNRLRGAADAAVTAARREDAEGLRRHLRRFDALTSALWTVQLAVYGAPPQGYHK